MLHLAVFAATLAAAPAPAAGSYADQQKELKTEADVLQALTDIAFLATAARKSDDQAAPSAGTDDADTAADPRLSRPRALSMVYDTLAALEYQQASAGGVGADAHVASRRVSALSKKGSLLIDPKTQTASRSYSRLSARVKAGSAGLTNVGRSTPPVANKKMAALQKSLDAVDVQLADPNTPPAAKAGLHAKAGKIYEDMAGAAALQASVAVVTQSVVDLDAPPADGTADVSDSGSDHPSARKSGLARPAASIAKLQSLASKIRSRKGSIVVKAGPKAFAGRKSAAAGKARAVSRSAALRSLYRQMAARDYRACLSTSLPKAGAAKVRSAIKRLAAEGEPAASDDASFADIDPSLLTEACGCPAGTSPLGDDSYGICYCAADSDVAVDSAAADALLPTGRSLARLQGKADAASRGLAARETPKSLAAKSGVSSDAEWRFQRAQSFERMAAVLTRPAFPAIALDRDGKPSLSRLPTASRLQKLAAQLRSGVGPVYVSRKAAKGGYATGRVARSRALAMTYRTMAALDYRAALVAGLPARLGARKAGVRIADDEDDAGGDYSGGGDASASDAGDGEVDVSAPSDSDSEGDATAYAGAGDSDYGDGDNGGDSAAVASSGDPSDGTVMDADPEQDPDANGGNSWNDAWGGSTSDGDAVAADGADAGDGPAAVAPSDGGASDQAEAGGDASAPADPNAAMTDAPVDTLGGSAPTCGGDSGFYGMRKAGLGDVCSYTVNWWNDYLHGKDSGNDWMNDMRDIYSPWAKGQGSGQANSNGTPSSSVNSTDNTPPQTARACDPANGDTPVSNGCLHRDGSFSQGLNYFYRKVGMTMKACPAESKAIHSTKAGFAICAVQGAPKAGKVAARPLFGRLAKLDRSADKISALLIAKDTPRARKGSLFLARAQTYARMAAEIGRPAARKSARTASKPPYKKSSRVADDASPDAATPPPVPAPETVTAPPAPPAPAAPDAAPAPSNPAPTEEEQVKRGESEMNDLEKEMKQEIQKRAAPAPGSGN